ncbi:hypothetical protein J3A83DRAFT_1970950 [Scleroderma citrinum]
MVTVHSSDSTRQYSMSLLVLAAKDVNAAISTLKPNELEHLMASVFLRLSSRSGYASPHRITIHMSQHTALFMPSRVDGIGTAVKVVSVPNSPVDMRGLPASTVLLEEETGCARAIINASALTALRTAAGSVLATRLLLVKQQPTSLVAFGAGKQIEAHAHLHIRAFPSLRRCTVVNRTQNARLDNLLSTLRRTHPSVVFDSLKLDEADSVKSAVERANVICTATSATSALFPSEWVSLGTHLNLVGSFKPGMIEVDDSLIRRAGMIVVDSKEACAAEAGELISAGVSSEKMVEIGTLVKHNDCRSRSVMVPVLPTLLCDRVRKSGDVTVFKSVGVGLQDVAIARLVVSRAEEMKIGTVVQSFYD